MWYRTCGCKVLTLRVEYIQIFVLTQVLEPIFLQIPRGLYFLFLFSFNNVEHLIVWEDDEFMLEIESWT